MSLETFTQSYIECALWSSTDNADDSGGFFMDANYSEDDIAPEAMDRINEDCADFYEAQSNIWTADPMYLSGDYSDARAGHDFWLTRNRHGAGFWDRGLACGDTLTDAAHVYGNVDLYVGDDGRIYL